jgi:putative SOS response-associated peptidase YedK
MCGRYVLAGDADDYVEFFDVDRVATESLEPNYNVAPTDPVYAIAEWDSERLLGTMRWGFVPHWAKDRKGMQINARSETVATKPMFRDSFRRKRCLIPANGFYEWEPKDRGRTPHFVYRADGYPMGFAGLWSTWKDPDTGEFIRTTIITAEAKGVIKGIHERTPLVLDPSVWDAWLDRDLTDPEEIEHLLQPIDYELISEHAVDSDVNSVKNNRPDLTSPAKAQRLL